MGKIGIKNSFGRITCKHPFPDSKSEPLSHNAKGTMLDRMNNDGHYCGSTKQQRNLLDLVLRRLPTHVIGHKSLGDPESEKRHLGSSDKSTNGAEHPVNPIGTDHGVQSSDGNMRWL